MSECRITTRATHRRGIALVAVRLPAAKPGDGLGFVASTVARSGAAIHQAVRTVDGARLGVNPLPPQQF